MSYTTDMPKWMRELTDVLLLTMPKKSRLTFQCRLIEALKRETDLCVVRWQLGLHLVEEHKLIRGYYGQDLDSLSVFNALRDLYKERDILSLFDKAVTDVPSLAVYVATQLLGLIHNPNLYNDSKN